jgi:pimeloyl-ACP methyl ester carboxylesterase
LDILVSSVEDRLDGPVDLLIGHSLGALAALALAGRNNRVSRALVLEEPPGFASVDTGLLAASVEADAALARSDPAGYEKRLREANPRWSAKDIEYAMEGVAEVDEVSVAAGLRGPFTWDLPTMFAAVNVPLLLILAPDAPGRFPLEPGSALRGVERERVSRLIPVDRLVVLEGGHALHRDQPEQWLSLVKSFADETLNG